MATQRSVTVAGLRCYRERAKEKKIVKDGERARGCKYTALETNLGKEALALVLHSFLSYFGWTNRRISSVNEHGDSMLKMSVTLTFAGDT